VRNRRARRSRRGAEPNLALVTAGASANRQGGGRRYRSRHAQGQARVPREEAHNDSRAPRGGERHEVGQSKSGAARPAPSAGVTPAPGIYTKRRCGALRAPEEVFLGRGVEVSCRGWRVNAKRSRGQTLHWVQGSPLPGVRGEEPRVRLVAV